MITKTERGGRSDVFLSVFLAWMLTVFASGVSVVALWLIAFSRWGQPGNDPQTATALTVAHLIVCLGAIAAGAVVSLVLRERARIIAWVVLCAIALSATVAIVSAWIIVSA